jgi:hypothetical protein
MVSSTLNCTRHQLNSLKLIHIYMGRFERGVLLTLAILHIQVSTVAVRCEQRSKKI